MADTNKKDEYDIFMAQSIYPEAMSIFTFQLKSLEEVKDDCYIVLDTNVLLAPYIIGKEDPDKDNLLEECQRIYQSLIEKKRLIVPGQVAREFANRRVDKLAELYQQLSEKRGKIQQITKGKYPLLNSLREYQEVEHLQDEINKKIREYQGAVSKVLAHIESWQLNDPVRSLYHQLFDESVIFDPQFDKEEIKKDLKRRQLHHIPPGYKDAGKEDSGVGDLLIWYTILELGKVHKKSVVFVSGDEKPDWFKQSQNVALHLRYELVDEFRRKSDNQSFHVVKFSRFLELYGASDKVVEEVRQEETRLSYQNEIESPLYHQPPWAYNAVLQWLTKTYPDAEFFHGGGQIDFFIVEPGGLRTAVKVIARSLVGTINDRIKEISPILLTTPGNRPINKLLIVNLTHTEEQAIEVTNDIKRNITLPDNISLVVGYINDNNSFVYRERLMRSRRPSYEAIFDEYRAVQQYEEENKNGE